LSGEKEKGRQKEFQVAKVSVYKRCSSLKTKKTGNRELFIMATFEAEL
jgi:hypothetical protein